LAARPLWLSLSVSLSRIQQHDFTFSFLQGYLSPISRLGFVCSVVHPLLGDCCFLSFSSGYMVVIASGYAIYGFDSCSAQLGVMFWRRSIRVCICSILCCVYNADTSPRKISVVCEATYKGKRHQRVIGIIHCLDIHKKNKYANEKWYPLNTSENRTYF
jgi:hypothetical protein